MNSVTNNQLFPAVGNLVGINSPLNPFVSYYCQKTGQTLAGAHVYWSAWRQWRLFQWRQENPQQGNPLVYGAVLDLLREKSTEVHLALTILLAAKCAMEIFEQHRVIYRAFLHTQSVFQDTPPNFRDLKFHFTNPYFSPSSQIQFQRLQYELKRYLKVIQSIAFLISEMGHLIMLYTDAFLLLKGERNVRYRNTSELMQHIQVYFSHDKQKKEFNRENWVWIERIGQRLNCEKEINSTIDHILKVIETAQTNFKTDVPTKVTPFGQFLESVEENPPLFKMEGNLPPWKGS